MHAGDVHVLLEGGVRFAYQPEWMTHAHACYGLNIAHQVGACNRCATQKGW